MTGNEEAGAEAALRYNIRKQLKYPGVDRNQMPEVPSKSEGLRKM